MKMKQFKFLLLFCLFVCLETGFHYVIQDGLELRILLSLPLSAGITDMTTMTA
jgi:hypothetical protein